MALGRKCASLKPRCGEVDLGLGLGLGYYTRGFGRKRVSVSKHNEAWGPSRLESLPREVLIRILCGVDHDDVEQLVGVSQTIREAAWVAKQCHFAYSTPKKNRSSLRSCIDFEEDDIEAPEAPRRIRPSGRSLLAMAEEERWPRKELFVEISEHSL